MFHHFRELIGTEENCCVVERGYYVGQDQVGIQRNGCDCNEYH